MPNGSDDERRSRRARYLRGRQPDPDRKPGRRTDADGNQRYDLYMHVGNSPNSVLVADTPDGVYYDGMSDDGTKVYFTTTLARRRRRRAARTSSWPMWAARQRRHLPCLDREGRHGQFGRLRTTRRLERRRRRPELRRAGLRRRRRGRIGRRDDLLHEPGAARRAGTRAFRTSRTSTSPNPARNRSSSDCWTTAMSSRRRRRRNDRS